VLRGGVIVEGDVDSLVGAVERIEGGYKIGGSVALVIMGCGTETAFIHAQFWLGPAKCLGLALCVKGQDYGGTEKIHIETNGITQFCDEA
jgi:hypothetical protein